MNNSSTFLSKCAKALAVGGAVVTISDLMQPIAPFAAYAMAVSFLFTIIVLGARVIGGLWNEPMSVSIYFSCGIFLLSSIVYVAQGKSGSANGILADNVDYLYGLQADLGFANKTLGEISRKIDGLKKETSSNPRKELSNLGISWDRESFYEALERGDQEVYQLFVAGGMKVDFGIAENLMRGENFSSDISDLILSKKAVKDDICPVKDGVVFYDESYLSDHVNLNFVRNVCSGVRYIDYIDLHIGELEAGLLNWERQRQTYERQYEVCMSSVRGRADCNLYEMLLFNHVNFKDRYSIDYESELKKWRSIKEMIFM